MQGISGHDRILIPSGSSVAGTRTTSSEPVVSCFVASFASACNTVVNRSTLHGTLSSPWHNERRDVCSPAKYSSAALFKAGANITKELSIAEYNKNTSESRDNSFSHRGMLNNTSEKYRR
ncbi:hypothetical protein [Klebsiella sp. BIGb0407]|uniref:hypothetical protein n=1 Tax=Klebsiella sp. BIGb0407 TaxID=2940603 RepID=UPI0021688E7B|nr:hypothetical protein [Klebsiella sp. BIGb0407]MCS3433931.1 hypothetical protein [Klebsiella sp. BIGb0407]